METIREFCNRTGLSKQRVAIWVKEGRLKGQFINFRWELEDGQEIPKRGKRGLATKQLKGLGKVKQYTKKGELVAEYLTLTEASKALKTSPANICGAMNNPKLSAMGYRWERKDLI